MIVEVIEIRFGTRLSIPQFDLQAPRPSRASILDLGHVLYWNSLSAEHHTSARRAHIQTTEDANTNRYFLPQFAVPRLRLPETLYMTWQSNHGKSTFRG
jgi:hypothetical protein